MNHGVLPGSTVTLPASRGLDGREMRAWFGELRASRGSAAGLPGWASAVALHAAILVGMTLTWNPVPPLAQKDPLTVDLIEPVPLPTAPVVKPPEMEPVKPPVQKAPLPPPVETPPKPQVVMPTPAPAPAPPVAAPPVPAAPVLEAAPRAEPTPLAPTAAPAPPAVAAPAAAPAPPAPPVAARPTPSSPPAPPAPIVGPVFNAAYLSNPTPAYPPISKRNNEEGKVLLRVLVSDKGVPLSVELRQSSGFTRLDNAALEAVRKWKFVPARQGSEAVEASVIVPITFSLGDEG
ncbi:MAG: energy transducer TonB [Burkholderiales bacterium]|nr:energy transducer TonB [Burkholderiales bacterium]